MAHAVPQPSTAYGQELAKWEMHHTRFTSDDAPPGRANVPFAAYPRMVYKAIEHPKTKQMVCMAIQPNPLQFPTPQEYDIAVRATDELNRRCYRIVNDDVEFRNAQNDGWYESPALALAGHEDEHWAGVVEETARRHYSDQRMSPKAQAEAAAVDASTEHQVPDVPTELRKQRERK